MARCDLARTSTLCPPPSSATRRSACRQSSLHINLDCQHYYNKLLYPSTIGHTWGTRSFFACHKLLKRFMKAQLLEQCMVHGTWYMYMVLRALFGGVESSSKSVYSSDSQLLSFGPSVTCTWYLAHCLGASKVQQNRCTRRTRNCCCLDPALTARALETHKKNNYSGISQTLSST